MRERENARAGEGDTERERESRCGAWTQEILTWAKIESQKLNWLSHSGAPKDI